jgi:hypothetical protein
MMDRGVIALLTGSVVLGIVLVVELGDTVDPPAIMPAPAPTEAPAPIAQTPQVGELIHTALARPLFSATRSPPNRPTGDSAAAPELPSLRLTGIVIEPDRRLAIFAVPRGKPLARMEGETINEWRLESVGPSQVALSGPTGTTILEPKSDPNLVRSKKIVQPAPILPQPPPVAIPGPLRRPAPTRPAQIDSSLETGHRCAAARHRYFETIDLES